ncbi:MAG: hypothetical protein KBG48_24795 [Kofleriaceae bacterium]|nr:hypothetical protein [Kofleriaceae bacterium]MBP9170645.1 hypothetical protein [Kofleriaceae bacterium]MBP9862802.1 hypothetical protein [Kofleriaceae bacterium]
MATTLILACSDDSPGDADAAVCDCPAAEPPITQSRIMRVDGPSQNIDNGGGVALAGCPANAIVLTGGCYVTNDGTGTGALLSDAGPIEIGATVPANGWRCVYSRNNTGSTVTVHAQVTCLLPAP